DASPRNDRPLTDYLATVSTEGFADYLVRRYPFRAIADFPVRPLKRCGIFSPRFCRHRQEPTLHIANRFLNSGAGNDRRTAGGGPRIEGTRQRVSGRNENFF